VDDALRSLHPGGLYLYLFMLGMLVLLELLTLSLRRHPDEELKSEGGKYPAGFFVAALARSVPKLVSMFLPKVLEKVEARLALVCKCGFVDSDVPSSLTNTANLPRGC
jgi:hypothetical protein